MNQYIIVYLGGDNPKSEAQGKEHFSKYQEWLKSLGDAIISPMNPIKDTHTINPKKEINNSSISRMSGYTIIQATDIKQAINLTKDCPFLEINGTLEISQLIKIP